MKLYDYWRSSAAFRMRIALNLKCIEYEREFIHLRRKDHVSDAYLTINPQGLVPALVDDDGTVLTQSMAMIEYLDETRPEGVRFIPEGAKGRARVRAISQAVACEIHPLNNLRVLRLLGSECVVLRVYFQTGAAVATRMVIRPPWPIFVWFRRFTMPNVSVATFLLIRRL
jgi:maleylacetoacetate isomerase